MLNELLEYYEYVTLTPISKPKSYSLGRLYEKYLDSRGLHRPLLILARGLIHHDSYDPSMPVVDIYSLPKEEFEKRIKRAKEYLEDYLYLKPEDVLSFVEEDESLRKDYDNYCSHLYNHRTPKESGIFMRNMLLLARKQRQIYTLVLDPKQKEALKKGCEAKVHNILSNAICIADRALLRRTGFSESLVELSNRAPFVSAKKSGGQKGMAIAVDFIMEYNTFSFEQILSEAIYEGPLRHYVASISETNLMKVFSKSYLTKKSPAGAQSAETLLKILYFFSYIKAMKLTYGYDYVPINWSEISCVLGSHYRSISDDKNPLGRLEEYHLEEEQSKIVILTRESKGGIMVNIAPNEDILDLIDIEVIQDSRNQHPKEGRIYIQDERNAELGGYSSYAKDFAPYLSKMVPSSK